MNYGISREVRSVKKIGIGYEEYKRFIDDDMYYIDKTMLIMKVSTMKWQGLSALCLSQRLRPMMR